MTNPARLLALLVALSSIATPALGSDHVPGRVLVKLPETERDAAAAVARISDEIGSTLRIERESVLGWYVLEVVSDGSRDARPAADIVDELKASRSADAVDAALDGVARAFMTPNDPQLSQQWPIDVLRLRQAWDTTTGSPNVTVAIVDSGIVAHEDLANVVIGGYDFVSDPASALDGDGRDSDPFDDGGQTVDCGNGPGSSGYHGTQVAGVIAANTNNGVGVAGTASGVKLVTVRALGACGTGSTADIVEAAWWAAGGEVPGVPNNPNPASIINLSLGGPGTCDGPYRDAFTAIDNAGIIAVVAAGNDAMDTAGTTPINCPGVIGVGATDHGDYLSGFSNYGAEVDVLAPGGDITYYQDEAAGVRTTVGPNPSDYMFTQGTSFSAPYVAGIVALMRSVDGALTTDSARSILQTTGRQAWCPGGGQYVACDRNRVDAADAVAAVAGNGSAPPTQDPPTQDPPTQNPPPGTPTGTMTCGTSVQGDATSSVLIPVQIDSPTSASLFLTWSNDADLDLYLYAANQMELDRSESADTNWEEIAGTLQAGSYLVEVYSYSGSAAFTLELDCGGGGGGDRGNGGGRGCSLGGGSSSTLTAWLLGCGAVLLRRRS